MLFNSIEFAIFLPIVFILYWVVPKQNLRIQNSILLLASYFFYGWWDWRFLSLIIFSSSVDYIVGIALSKEKVQAKRKLLLLVSIFVNIGFLGIFKYFNFFAENFANVFTLFGKHYESHRLNLILPVGISFYTFQTLSYTIDIYKRKLEPTKDIIAFFTFVSFFPQLVAGPIERATNLLPQFLNKRIFCYSKAVDGLRQILWGLFKKMVIADNCAIYVNNIFANYNDYHGSTLLLGTLLFTFQIYGDFSGYSDIAIGTARLFGTSLKRNFAFPYFSRDIAEFWRRWHISLTSWFRDYVYIPLGGSRGGDWKYIRNILIIFLISGLWHGANWTFLAWGLINALYFIPLMLLKKNRINTNTVAQGKVFPTMKEMAQMGLTFFLTSIAWVFFRAESISSAIYYLKYIFSYKVFIISTSELKLLSNGAHIIYLFAFLIVFVIVEWLQREKQHAFEFSGINLNKNFRWGFYYLIILIILSFGTNQQEFIYFQF